MPPFPFGVAKCQEAFDINADATGLGPLSSHTPPSDTTTPLNKNGVLAVENMFRAIADTASPQGDSTADAQRLKSVFPGGISCRGREARAATDRCGGHLISPCHSAALPRERDVPRPKSQSQSQFSCCLGLPGATFVGGTQKSCQVALGRIGSSLKGGARKSQVALRRARDSELN